MRSGFDAASADRQAIRSELQAVRGEVHALAERVARLEGAFSYSTGARAVERAAPREPEVQ